MRYLLMFAGIAAVVVSIEVIGGHGLSGSVVFLALCASRPAVRWVLRIAGKGTQEK